MRGAGVVRSGCAFESERWLGRGRCTLAEPPALSTGPPGELNRTVPHPVSEGQKKSSTAFHLPPGARWAKLGTEATGGSDFEAAAFEELAVAHATTARRATMAAAGRNGGSAVLDDNPLFAATVGPMA